jgi:hypothetical protein
VTTPLTSAAWAQLCGRLPDHQTEVMAAHGGQPTIAEQDRTHGAPFIGGGLPAVDKGQDDRSKLT